MNIEWMGHASFCITSQTGLKLITDQYEPGFRNIIQYSPVNQSADIVTVSHDHGDHNHVSSVSGNPAAVEGSGIMNVKGVEFKGIAVYHDRVNGIERGSNTVLVFRLDAIRLAHLGDLGHPLSSEQLGELEGTEILFAPTGGSAATLELQGVIDLWESLKPQIVIPMHFNTAKCTFPKYKAKDLIRLRPDARKMGVSALSVTKEGLPVSTQILILDPLR